MPKTRQQRQLLDDSSSSSSEDESPSRKQPFKHKNIDDKVEQHDDDSQQPQQGVDANNNVVVPATEDAMEFMADMIEYKAEMMLYDKMMRADHHETLVFFWNLYPFHIYHFGQLYARFKFSQLLATVCTVLPYEDEAGQSDQLEGAIPPVKPMKYWSERFYWENVQECLETCHTLFLRRDTCARLTMDLTPTEMGHLEQPHVLWNMADDDDEGKERNPSGNRGTKMRKITIPRKLRILRFALEVQKIIAPIRVALEEAVETYEDKGVDQIQEGLIPTAALNEIGAYVEDSVENEEVKQEIQKLFDGIDKNGNLTLKRIKEVKDVLDSYPFDLEWLQENTELLVHWWTFETFDKDPALLKHGYRCETRDVLTIIRQPRHKRYQAVQATATAASRHLLLTPSRAAAVAGNSPPRSPHDRITTAEIEELRKGRKALKANHGDDPLESSRKAASKVVVARRAQEDERDKAGNDESDTVPDENEPTSKRRRLSEKKKSAQQLTFRDDIEADEEEEHAAVVRLGLSPQRPSPYFPKKYEGPIPDEGVFNEIGRVTKRRRFTDEEKTAIKSGLFKFGWRDPQKWVHIKEEYGELLRNRTGVQLKDCWRTMVKKGEVTQEEIDELYPDD